MAIENSTLFEEEKTTVFASEVSSRLNDPDIEVCGFYAHNKALEKYVVLNIKDGSVSKEWIVPYLYRRTNVFVDTVDDLVTLIRNAKDSLTQESVGKFKKKVRGQLSTLFGENSLVTRPIFETLLDQCGEWVLNKDFNNVNSQRRIQDIKQMGFTLSTRFGSGRKTYHSLLPFDQVKSFSYETIPTKIRKQIIKVHGNVDAFAGKVAGISVLPDHKFPEIRWATDTPVSNEKLTHTEMRDKFQLVPEPINQAKREVCRKCFQTGCRGMLNGIDYFYKGDSKWDSKYPKTGKDAEQGCVGCFWYDMLAWRSSLNQFIKEHL